MHPVKMKYPLFFFALMLCACAAPVVQTDTPHVAAAYISPQEHYFEAVRRGDITMVMRLVEEGLMNIGHKDVYGWTLSLIHISEPTRLLSISYAVFCLKKKTKTP